MWDNRPPQREIRANLAFSATSTQNGLTRETVKPSLRKVLEDSHVAAVAIAFLLLWSLGAVFEALREPVSRVGVFLITAIAIWDIPDYSRRLAPFDRLMMISSFYLLYSAVAGLSAALLLSRWVYGTGPLRSLAAFGMKAKRRNSA